MLEGLPLRVADFIDEEDLYLAVLQARASSHHYQYGIWSQALCIFDHCSSFGTLQW